jgi:hypothetical protein
VVGELASLANVTFDHVPFRRYLWWRLFAPCCRFFNWVFASTQSSVTMACPTSYDIVPARFMVPHRDVQHGDDMTNCGIFVCYYMMWAATRAVRMTTWTCTCLSMT